MFAKVLVIAVFCIATSYQYTPFSGCEQGPIPLALRVKECTGSPCRFVRGNNVTAQWDFNAVADTEDLRPVVKVIMNGLVINYPLPDQNACQSLVNSQCPLEKDAFVTYALNMPVHKSYPKVSLRLAFSLVDNNDNVHTCFEINAKVVDS